MKVAVGLSTYVGFFLAALAGITPIIGELADAANPLGVSPDLWVKVSAVLAVATVLGRMLQAIAAQWPQKPPAPPS